MADVKKEYGFEDEINWVEKLSNPTQWYPIYYIVLLIGIVYGGVYYLNNMNDMKKQEIANSYYFANEISEADQLNIDSEGLVMSTYDEMASKSDMKSKMLSASIMTVKNDGSQAAMLLKSSTNNLAKSMIMLTNNSSWKSGLANFKAVVTASIPENGFNSNFTEMSDEQLLNVHALLLNQLK